MGKKICLSTHAGNFGSAKSSVPPPLHVSGCEIAYSSRHILSMFKCGTIGHPCYDQLKAVQKGCLLTSVT